MILVAGVIGIATIVLFLGLIWSIRYEKHKNDERFKVTEKRGYL